MPSAVRARPLPTLPRTAWDAAIASLAAAQHGVVTRRQLLDMGITSAGIAHRLRRGRLHAVHPGVYAVGHRRLSPTGRIMAAALAGGSAAVVGHRSAAALWGLLPSAPQRVDVVVSRAAAQRAGIRWHRVGVLPAEDRSRVAGVPVTSPERTVLDVCPEADERTLDRMLRRMEDLRLFDRPRLEAIARRPAPGVGRLREALAALSGDVRAGLRTKSELERCFLQLLQRHGLALPSTNVTLRTPWMPYEVDALWPADRLVVELDGWSTHRDRETFRRDHRRTADLTAAGYRVLRLTWEQVVDQPAACGERLRCIVPQA